MAGILVLAQFMTILYGYGWVSVTARLGVVFGFDFHAFHEKLGIIEIDE